MLRDLVGAEDGQIEVPSPDHAERRGEIADAPPGKQSDRLDARVDEIDVGKMKEGMEVEIKVGALPTDTVKGILRKIWLKAQKKDNATVFPIEILIPGARNTTLRAGYSANANIIIQKKNNVLTIPERVVTFRNDSSFVKIPLAAGKDQEKLIKTGLSDAISIEVVSGLKEGDEVLEKPLKKID